MIAVPGRVLPRPSVTYSGRVKAKSKVGASWNMRDLNFVEAATMLPWAMLRIGAAAKVPADLLEEQYSSLITAFTSCGLKGEEAQFSYKTGPLIRELKPPDELGTKLNKNFVSEQLRATLSKCKQYGIRMLLVILPSKDPWLYDRIKYFGDFIYGISA